MIRRIATVAALAAFLLGSQCNPGPRPPPPDSGGTGGQGPVPVAGAGGGVAQTLESRACVAARDLCGTNFGECLRQVIQLRNSGYATLTDDDLECWVSASDRASLVACGNGACQ